MSGYTGCWTTSSSLDTWPGAAPAHQPCPKRAAARAYPAPARRAERLWLSRPSLPGVLLGGAACSEGRHRVAQPQVRRLQGREDPSAHALPGPCGEAQMAQTAIPLDLPPPQGRRGGRQGVRGPLPLGRTGGGRRTGIRKRPIGDGGARWRGGWEVPGRVGTAERLRKTVAWDADLLGRE